MKVLITGGAGFIGSNVAKFYASQNAEVFILDNLSRNGTVSNINFLKKEYSNINFIHCDIRFDRDVLRIFKEHSFDAVFHLAAQVAVTTSVVNPRDDFDINALGTFNVLEAMRQTNSKAFLLYSSTNKVYGGMEEIVIVEKDGRYQYRDYPEGILESNNLDFHSPYGCSKGAADQYVRDYSRIYGLNTTVFRQSCIYGYRQFGIEDQGWVAWFTIAAAFGSNLTIYGDGKQVRDVLFIDDLVNAYDMAYHNKEKVNGKEFNIGGGKYQMSLLELLAYLEKYIGRKIEIKFGEWRPGDQKVYVSNNNKALNEFGWSPKVSQEEGVLKLYNWIKDNEQLFKDVGII